MTRMPDIVVAMEDYNILSALLDSVDSDDETVESLEEELSRANLVKREKLPKDVVTMNARVRFRNETTGDEHEMTLVYPNESQGGPGRISVLAPAGAALLGLTVGDVIDWPMQGGKPLRIRILGVNHSSA